eukprot:3805130-Alexandrium_andersonii.AAC.1
MVWAGCADAVLRSEASKGESGASAREGWPLLDDASAHGTSVSHVLVRARAAQLRAQFGMPWAQER